MVLVLLFPLQVQLAPGVSQNHSQESRSR